MRPCTQLCARTYNVIFLDTCTRPSNPAANSLARAVIDCTRACQVRVRGSQALLVCRRRKGRRVRALLPSNLCQQVCWVETDIHTPFSALLAWDLASRSSVCTAYTHSHQLVHQKQHKRAQPHCSQSARQVAGLLEISSADLRLGPLPAPPWIRSVTPQGTHHAGLSRRSDGNGGEDGAQAKQLRGACTAWGRATSGQALGGASTAEMRRDVQAGMRVLTRRSVQTPPRIGVGASQLARSGCVA
eukprot:366212-Chlamydomonas_euryale.AAC.35